MLFNRRIVPYILMGLTDVLAIGFGMGIPALAILFGFPVGWWYARRTAPVGSDGTAISRTQLARLLEEAVVLSFVSLIVLFAIWGPQIPKALAPGFDASGWGIPLILYTSRPSIIAWFVLMLVVSPGLQFMAVLTGGAAAFVARPKHGRVSARSIVRPFGRPISSD